LYSYGVALYAFIAAVYASSSAAARWRVRFRLNERAAPPPPPRARDGREGRPAARDGIACVIDAVMPCDCERTIVRDAFALWRERARAPRWRRRSKDCLLDERDGY
jgi:hypothetical protein